MRSQNRSIRPRGKHSRPGIFAWLWIGASLAVDPLEGAVVLTEPPSPLVAFDPFEPPIELDIDGNGTVELIIPGSTRQINALPQLPSRVLGFPQPGSSVFAADLSEGSFIGAQPGAEMIWDAGSLIMSACFSGGGLFCGGNFLGGVEYLGVEFEIDGATHYGWVEVESRENIQFVIVHRWAYESEAGEAIRAGRVIPEPSGIVLLLVGVVLAFRRARVSRQAGHR